MSAERTQVEPGAGAPGQAANRPGAGAIMLGTAGGLMITLGGYGAAAVPESLVIEGPLASIRYGHGRMLATLAVYAGFVLLVTAWVWLGRQVLARTVGARPVLLAVACWNASVLLAPALFTRDVYSYLAQGALALRGQNPYAVGPIELGTAPVVSDVHWFWQSTPAPYGPLFILLAKAVAWLAGGNVLAGVLLTRLVQLTGLGLLLWAVPRLVGHLGGRLPVSLWLVLAGPVTVVHLVGGPHNDLLMVGLLAAGTVLVLDRRHVVGVVVVTLGVAVKATAAVALPFLVWVWAGHLESARARNVIRAMAGTAAAFVVTFAAVTLVSGVGLGWVGMLSSSSRLVNWLSLPTAAGELVHALVGIVVDLNIDYFVTVTRVIGIAVLVVLLARLWWRARDGGTDAIRKAALALFAVAILSPAMLPWYLTWGLVLAAGFALRRVHLAVAVGVSAFMVAPYSPAGEQLLYEWPLMVLAVAGSVLAGWRLLRQEPDAPEADPVPDRERVTG